MKNKKLFPVLWVMFWYFLAHGYRMAHNMFSHDSLLGIVQNDSAWQIALGRFMQPVLVFFRGGLTGPWLITCLSLIWFTAAVLLVLDILQIKSPLFVAALSGIMICNPTTVASNASFLPWVDFYAFSLFLAVSGVWLSLKRTALLRRRILFRIAGIACIAVSMGIYQAYVCVSIALWMLVFMQEACREERPRTYLLDILKCFGTLGLSAACYYLAWQVFLRVLHIGMATTYNGLSELWNYSETSLPALLGLTYRKTLDYFLYPTVFVTMEFQGSSLSVIWLWIIRILNLLTALLIPVSLGMTWKAKKMKLWQRLAQTAVLLLFPMGMNFVCLLSKGMEHTLMVYAFIFFYILYILLYEKSCIRVKTPLWRQALLLLPVFCVVYCNVVYANQVYLKKSLQDKATTSLMTRIVGEMESMEGYVPGTTPVAFAGSPENSPYLQSLPGFEELLPIGMGNTTTTYPGTDYAFLRYELNVPIREVRVAADDPAVREMPSYPARGSIAYVGDVLVVKLSP